MSRGTERTFSDGFWGSRNRLESEKYTPLTSMGLIIAACYFTPYCFLGGMLVAMRHGYDNQEKDKAYKKRIRVQKERDRLKARLVRLEARK